MVSWENTGKLITWMLYTSFILILIVSILNPTWITSFKSSNTVNINNDEKYFSNPKVKKYLKPKKNKAKTSKRKRKYSYIKYDQVPIQLDSTPYKNTSLFTYDDLKLSIEDKTFIDNHYSSVLNNLQYKYNVYNEKLDEVTIELNAALEKQGNDPMAKVTLDTATTRLKRHKVSIEQIIREIPKKIANLSRSGLQRDLRMSIYDESSGLESLIGRTQVKDFLSLQLSTFTQNPSTFNKSFHNILLYGNSGIGKTKLASVMGFFYSKSGMFIRDKFRNVTKKEFTSSYVNETSHMTSELLYSSMDGVLFIDEAYELGPDNSILGRGKDNGGEAITELVNFLDKNEGLGVIIAAGYENVMESRFVASNQGMNRRFPDVFRLTDYDSRQLTDILLSFIEDKLDIPTTSSKSSKNFNIELTDGDAGVLYTILDYIIVNHSEKNVFSKQAGDMKNLAGKISDVIYGNRTLKWENGNTISNSNLLTIGVNTYLSPHGISIRYKKNSQDIIDTSD